MEALYQTRERLAKVRENHPACGELFGRRSFLEASHGQPLFFLLLSFEIKRSQVVTDCENSFREWVIKAEKLSQLVVWYIPAPIAINELANAPEEVKSRYAQLL
jgi:hypothetical protein